ncbi:hypothetical protein AAMO2058_000839700 [Amorphochlora amoebiformis]
MPPPSKSPKLGLAGGWLAILIYLGILVIFFLDAGRYSSLGMRGGRAVRGQIAKLGVHVFPGKSTRRGGEAGRERSTHEGPSLRKNGRGEEIRGEGGRHVGGIRSSPPRPDFPPPPKSSLPPPDPAIDLFPFPPPVEIESQPLSPPGDRKSEDIERGTREGRGEHSPDVELTKKSKSIVENSQNVPEDPDPCHCISQRDHPVSTVTHRQGCFDTVDIESGQSDPVCYVHGGSKCNSAKPSNVFSNIYWRFCDKFIESNLNPNPNPNFNSKTDFAIPHLNRKPNPDPSSASHSQLCDSCQITGDGSLTSCN